MKTLLESEIIVLLIIDALFPQNLPKEGPSSSSLKI